MQHWWDKIHIRNRSSRWAQCAWWALLLVSVLAVASIACVVALLVPGNSLVKLLLLVSTCWVCTFLGMKATKTK